jgi:hypothetical protein
MFSQNAKSAVYTFKFLGRKLSTTFVLLLPRLAFTKLAYELLKIIIWIWVPYQESDQGF